MKPVDLTIVFAKVVFGVLAVGAVGLLLVSFFIFDSPTAIDNPLAWNLAAAPLAYLAIYAYSLSQPSTIAPPRSIYKARLIRACTPLLGIAWYGIALLLLQVLCGGSFGCRSH